jgi:hypothetical protein
MERGNPPGKEGSLGDRINWEILLEKVPKGEDVHIISRDKDFASPWGAEIPNSYLKVEWKSRKKGNLFLYAGLRSFVKQHFPEIVLASDIDKKFAVKELGSSQSWAATHAAISKLAPLSTDLTSEEAKQLFSFLVSNPEIHAISEDEDVKSFYQDLLTNHWEVLTKEEYEKVTGFVEDPIPF